MNIANLLQLLMQNPLQTLTKYNFTAPQNIFNNPQAIVQHLVSTGQISQSQVNDAMVQAQRSPLFRGF